MSLVTTCPACGTHYRIRPEQLSARGGRVRCGHCAQAFDALASLTEINISSAPEMVSAHASGTALAHTVMQPVVATQAQSIAPAPQDGVQKEEQPLAASQVPAPKTAAVALAPAPRTGPRLLLGLLLLLLLMLGVAQLAYHLRTPLATALPAARPLLEQACAMLGCRVELPRRVELLSIEDSELRRDSSRNDAYVLTANLFNHAPYTMAYPLLELTLTDINDKPLLRRRLTPAEYLPANRSAELGIAAGSDVWLHLYFIAEQLPVAGYRVYITY